MATLNAQSGEFRIRRASNRFGDGLANRPWDGTRHLMQATWSFAGFVRRDCRTGEAHPRGSLHPSAPSGGTRAYGLQLVQHMLRLPIERHIW